MASLRLESSAIAPIRFGDRRRQRAGGAAPATRERMRVSGTYSFYAVRVFTTRFDEALAFYRDIVGFPVGFVSADMGWAEFDLGGARFALERSDPDDPESRQLVGRFAAVSIEVDDIDATWRRLTAAGVGFPGPPERQPWGGILAHFSDPDGNVITLLGRDRSR
jgi:predicted enzyme related to lactoylglutathione lyase